MAHNLGFWIKWTLQLWPTRSRSQTVSDCLNSFNGLWGDNKTISVGGIVDGFLFAKYFLPPTLSPALPSSNHVSCVFLSVYIEMQSLVYIFSLYTVHLSALDIHNHLPTLNTSLYIQCGWVELDLTRTRPCTHMYLIVLSWQYAFTANVNKINRGKTFFFSNSTSKVIEWSCCAIARGSVNKGEALSSTRCVGSSLYA